MARSTKNSTKVESNPVGIDPKVAAALVAELDAHVSSLFILFHQYQKHHWLVEGPQFRDLHLHLGESYEAVHDQVDQLAERITLLGGIPTSNPVEQAHIAYVKHEAEGRHPIRQCLEADMAMEGTIARRLRASIEQAGRLGDYGTRALLEQNLLKVEDRAYHLEHFLGKDTL